MTLPLELLLALAILALLGGIFGADPSVEGLGVPGRASQGGTGVHALPLALKGESVTEEPKAA